MRPLKKERNYYDEIKRQAEIDQKRLYVGAMFNIANGYGDLARNFCLEANKMIDLGILPHGDFHAHLRKIGLGHCLESPPLIPNSLLSIQPTFSLMQKNTGKRSAIYTMFEASKLRREWIAAINSFQICIVPSNHNAQFFREQVSIPVEVANLGHDHNMFTYCKPPTKGPFVFGAAGHVGHGRNRKGIERIIEWFTLAFGANKDVRLKLKLNKWPDNEIMPSDPRIEVIENDLSEEDCRDWLRSLHCYIDGSTFEGWGMWNHNAMATGRPVIGTYYSARCEYFRFGNHIPIGYKLTSANDQYQGLGHWAMPNHVDAIEAMRWAYKNPDQCEAIGKKAHQTVEPMTWKRFARRVLLILKKHGVTSK